MKKEWTRTPFILVILLFIALPQLVFSQPEPHFKIQIVDEANDPLIGATIIIEGQEGGYVTDTDGYVTIGAFSDEKLVTVRYLGYADIELSFAEFISQGKVTLIEDAASLETVILIGRSNESRAKIFRELEFVNQKEFQVVNPQTTVRVLETKGGVFVQRSQMGGGSPILRGFEANRVLLVIDGVRLNNAIYRNGHLQNAITVDPNMLEQIEVVFGPGALMYGSDALGGVIHFRSRRPFPKSGEPNFNLNAMLRYSTANQEKATHLNYLLQRSKWAFSGSVTLTDYGDLRVGNRRPSKYPNFGSRPFYQAYLGGQDVVNPNARIKKDGGLIPQDRSNYLVETGYSQVDISHQATYQASPSFFLTGNMQFSTSSNIPRYDNLQAEPTEELNTFRFAEWYYGPQTRGLASLTARIDKQTKLFESANIISSVQYLQEQRIKRRFERSDRETQQDDVLIGGLTADFRKTIKQQSLRYGLDLQYNLVESTAWAENIETNDISNNILTRFPSGNNNTQQLGAYASYLWESVKKYWKAEVGLRYSFNRLQSNFQASDPVAWPSDYIDPGISAQNQQVTWSTGLKYDHPAGWRFKASLGTAFRAPNLDDFTKIRERGGFVTIPNPDLSPERSLNAELGIGKSTSGDRPFSIDAIGWYTQLRDAIVRQILPLPNGDSFLLQGGDTLITLGNVNADEAFLYGGGLRMDWKFARDWEIGSRIDYTYGRNRFQKEIDDQQIDEWVPFAHIPPIYGNTFLRYEKRNLTLECRVDYQAAKKLEEYAVSDINLDADGNLEYDRSGSSDNLDYSPYILTTEGPEFQGTYAWYTINLYGSWQFEKRFKLNVAFENILDQHYRTFSSGLSAPGFNFVIGLSGSF